MRLGHAPGQTTEMLLSLDVFLIRGFVGELSSALGLSPLGPYHALMYGRSLYFDITRAKEELGWQPTWSNEEMICQSYDWYRAHKQEIQQQAWASPHRSARPSRTPR